MFLRRLWLKITGKKFTANADGKFEFTKEELDQLRHDEWTKGYNFALSHQDVTVMFKRSAK